MRVALPLLFTLVAACADSQPTALPPFGQLVVYVDTDAPLPAPAGENTGGDAPSALFDRLRIDVIRPGESEPCADCTHEFDLDARLMAAHRASVGITPPVGATGFVARARLFKAAFAQLGEPRGDATIDATVRLPPIAPEGVTPVTIQLRTDDVGRPIGSIAEPAAPILGTPPPGFTGSWKGAERTNCPDGSRRDDGRVCVPGGAFWVGNPLGKTFHVSGEPFIMRIAVVDPFFLDPHEVTVADFRDSGLATETDPQQFDGTDGHPGFQTPCTFTKVVGNYEELPLTCISWQKARDYCLAHDTDLPTEIQLQYAGSGMRGSLYVWGDDPPVCGDAVYARFAEGVPPFMACPGKWIEPPGRGQRDRLVRPDGVIVDLNGNATEHALDIWNGVDEACWGPGVFRNPLCEMPTAYPRMPGVGEHTVIGGNWAQIAFVASANTRQPGPDFDKAISTTTMRNRLALALAGTGFRCARKAKP